MIGNGGLQIPVTGYSRADPSLITIATLATLSNFAASQEGFVNTMEIDGPHPAYNGRPKTSVADDEGFSSRPLASEGSLQTMIAALYPVMAQLEKRGGASRSHVSFSSIAL